MLLAPQISTLPYAGFLQLVRRQQILIEVTGL